LESLPVFREFRFRRERQPARVVRQHSVEIAIHETFQAATVAIPGGSERERLGGEQEPQQSNTQPPEHAHTAPHHSRREASAAPATSAASFFQEIPPSIL